MYNYRNNAGWRRKVTWDDERKLYTYRGQDILPLSWQERDRLPVYLQHNYYWDEIEAIDRKLELEEKTRNFHTENADIGLAQFFNFVDGNIDLD